MSVKKTIFNVMGIAVIAVCISFMVPLNCSAFEITIDVAPNVLNLANNGKVVTVHTDIAYSDVEASTVYINNVPINTWKSDLRGYFVAKFIMNEVKKLPFTIDEYNTLTLIGITSSHESFWGSQDILVVKNGPGK